MITYKQLTLAEIFEDCQNKFDNDKYRFVNLFYYITCKLIHNKKEQPNFLDYSLFITSMIIIS